METEDAALSMLNVFEVSEPEGVRHYLGFVDTILAGSKGLHQSWVVGDFEPGKDGAFDPTRFRLNPVFVATFTQYMNEVASRSPELEESAMRNPSGWLYLLDPRCVPAEGEEPPATELLGCFAVDETGRIVPGSFLYNENHRWFEDERGVSGASRDRRFYDWLHPTPGP